MAYREHGMWEVLEVLRKIFRGEGRRAIERTTGRSRKTIGRYVRTAKKLGWDPGHDEPDEELASGVLERLRPGPRGVSPGESEKMLIEHKEQIRTWLDRDNPYKRVIDTGFSEDLGTVYGGSGNNIFVMGFRIILHYDGISWTGIRNDTDYYFSDIWVSVDGDVYTVGFNDYLFTAAFKYQCN